MVTCVPYGTLLRVAMLPSNKKANMYFEVCIYFQNYILQEVQRNDNLRAGCARCDVEISLQSGLKLGTWALSGICKSGAPPPLY